MVKKKLKASRGTVPRERPDELRASILKLSDACPFHLANPQDCPLSPLRKLKPAKRVEWVNALSEDDLIYLTLYHRVCLRIKGESRPR
jgi:hypothetical protein